MIIADYFRKANATREGVASRYSDLLLVGGIVAIVAMMVLPLPAWLIDGLVAVNILTGLVLLLLGVYIASPLEFSSFPSVLLLSTLFRLSLSIATTRMILLHGEGGHIIDTFGKTVAGGNLVVGLVVFLIITVVQFIVIAKGAERVAEVAARFSLDAMPGKQLSIDSDLRSGLIDKDEAKRKRRNLETESKLHGSLDGAMKFVKGDAIAGIVIIAINLLGGLGVGVMMQDLDIATAIQKYSILTIGDGMVAQIPALLGAMAAGLIVTRTTDEDDRHLGDAIRKQVASKPRVLVVAAGICLMLTMVPGFPKAVFLALAALCGIAGALLSPAVLAKLRRVDNAAVKGLVQKFDAPQSVGATEAQVQRPSVPLLLRVPSSLLVDGQGHRLTATMQDVLDGFQLTLGLNLPKIHLFGHDDVAGDKGRWELLAFEVPIAGDVLPQDPAFGLGEPVRDALRRNAHLFIGTQDTYNLLSRAQADLPEVVKEVTRALPAPRIAEVFRRLVSEGVSIRNLRGILESMGDIVQREKDVHVVAEWTRISLGRQICHQFAPTGELRVAKLNPVIEEALRKSLRVANGTTSLALSPDDTKLLTTAILESVSTHNADAVVVPWEIRYFVRQLIKDEAFDTPVLAQQELSSTKVNVITVDVISPVPQAPALRVAA